MAKARGNRAERHGGGERPLGIGLVSDRALLGLCCFVPLHGRPARERLSARRRAAVFGPQFALPDYRVDLYKSLGNQLLMFNGDDS